ncbi:hypothetical protein [Roseovarius dicentrarchi]|uniref:hypothetical protein n=1 Tax=Roseovarius dicentrarchi TaxID=2250573 RepID=UPI000DE83D03|nr:hypothetical protein [Roseovarius dicentrarchi]
MTEPLARGTNAAIKRSSIGGIRMAIRVAELARAGRGYEGWWRALDWVSDGLMMGGMLREVEVTAVMPKMRPWR